MTDFFNRKAGIEVHTLPDQSLLLYEKDKGVALPLNESGTKVWNLLDGTHTVDDIIDTLTVYYDAPRTEIDRDTREFLAVLLRHGVLDRQSSQP